MHVGGRGVGEVGLVLAAERARRRRPARGRRRRSRCACRSRCGARGWWWCRSRARARRASPRPSGWAGRRVRRVRGQPDVAGSGDVGGHRVHSPQKATLATRAKVRGQDVGWCSRSEPQLCGNSDCTRRGAACRAYLCRSAFGAAHASPAAAHYVQSSLQAAHAQLRCTEHSVCCSRMRGACRSAGTSPSCRSPWCSARRALHARRPRVPAAMDARSLRLGADQPFTRQDRLSSIQRVA